MPPSMIIFYDLPCDITLLPVSICVMMVCRCRACCLHYLEGAQMLAR